ncbi:MAG: DNA polymerase III subunit gamma/tau [Oscillospiraceae bacterium]|nr:DNA polymerase III subunit gamma/tau [Oscillospiraceae bacterium]
MYQALYRKWRPQTFDEVVGQKHITETLKNQVKTGRLSHAYIFIGTRGTGKTTCARILAKAVNCENPADGNPCGVCPACRGISEGSVLDVVELDAASNNSVDNVRALREEAVFSPATVKKRVYIIDEVHMLSTSAFNALLKILEEPPEHLMFILATTELQKVPATILSRCQRHSFKRIDAPAIAEYLEFIAGKEGFRLEHDAAELIARLADGGVRDALSLLDQCSASDIIDLDAVYYAMGLAGNRRTAALMESVLDHRTEKAIKDFNSLWMDGKDPTVLLTELSGLLRDVLMMKVAPKGSQSLISGGYDSATLESLGARMTKDELICAMETLQAAQTRIRAGATPKTTAELCLVSLCDNTLEDSIAALRARISRLEEQIKNGTTVYAAPSPRYEEELPPPPEEEYPEPASYEPPAVIPASYEPAPTRPEAAPPPVEAAQTAEPMGTPPEEVSAINVSWKEIAAQTAPLLPKDISTRLDDEKSVRGTLEGSLLRLEVVPGFLYGRFNRQEVLAKFSETASRLAGHEVRAQLSELSDDPGSSKRSLEDLKAFKEVRFV